VTRQTPIELLRDLVDHELVDSTGTSCGQVDDVELSADGSGVTALLVGASVWSRRLPALAQVAIARLGLRGRVRVPVATIDAIEEVIRLNARASELGLGVQDRKVGKWLSRFPMS
jgi:sporulation protein YlmC with PRC-barrel domain